MRALDLVDILTHDHYAMELLVTAIELAKDRMSVERERDIIIEEDELSIRSSRAAQVFKFEDEEEELILT